MGSACMTLYFQGAPEEPFRGAMMTIGRWVGRLQTGGRAHTGNVSLDEWPKEISHSWHCSEAPGSIRPYTNLSGFS